MSEIILHHYPLSPFSEKVRLALGAKGLSYRSVIIPVVMPKPDLIPLTGGYRRTPVMQVGADIYCDTSLILHELERRHPHPPLYPAGQEGLVTSLAWWAEKNLFVPAVSLVFCLMGDHFPKEIIRERRAFGFHLDPAELRPKQALFQQRLQVHLGWLADMLADGRPFLLGREPSAADLAAFHPIWFALQNGGPEMPRQLPLEPLRAWYDDVAALGHGRPSELSSTDALAIAKQSKPDPAPDGRAIAGIKIGDRVQVTPDDTGRDPVTGTLMGVTSHEIVIHRVDAEVGKINVHFPRAGFDVTPASIVARPEVAQEASSQQ